MTNANPDRRTVASQLGRLNDYISEYITEISVLSPSERDARWKSIADSALSVIKEDAANQFHTDDTGDQGFQPQDAASAAAGKRGDTPKDEFGSSDTPFRSHASAFAFRDLTSIGHFETLLREEKSKCDVCLKCKPCVIDTCVSLSGDRLCRECDSLRHELGPCRGHRWVLLRQEINGQDVVALRLLLPNEFVVAVPSDAAITDDADDSVIESEDDPCHVLYGYSIHECQIRERGMNAFFLSKFAVNRTHLMPTRPLYPTLQFSLRHVAECVRMFASAAVTTASLQVGTANWLMLRQCQNSPVSVVRTDLLCV